MAERREVGVGGRTSSGLGVAVQLLWNAKRSRHLLFKKELQRQLQIQGGLEVSDEVVDAFVDGPLSSRWQWVFAEDGALGLVARV